jgi:hypothetical protein
VKKPPFIAEGHKPVDLIAPWRRSVIVRCRTTARKPIRKRQLHFQSMPVREPKLAEAHMPDKPVLHRPQQVNLLRMIPADRY